MGSLDQVVAPPYDTISPEQQHRLNLASPYNVVRLILARYEPDGAADLAERYVGAAHEFRRWREAGSQEQVIVGPKPNSRTGAKHSNRGRSVRNGTGRAILGSRRVSFFENSRFSKFEWQGDRKCQRKR